MVLFFLFYYFVPKSGTNGILSKLFYLIDSFLMKADSWITGLWKHETMLILVGFIYIHAMMLYVNQSVMCEQVTAWREIQNE